jgi:hypothetical protein
MAKSPQQIDHAAEFWDRHLAQPYIIDDKSLSLLDAAIASLKAKSTFSLEHIQALVLSVSLSEGQMRDCIRLAIDSSFMEIDPENPLIKDVKFDFRLLNSMRDRRLTVGGFFRVKHFDIDCQSLLAWRRTCLLVLRFFCVICELGRCPERRPGCCFR